MVPDPEDFLDYATINWQRISRASAFYSALGYQYLEVPWVAPTEVVRATLPASAKPFKVEGWPVELVGSAEQSLLWYSALDKVPPGQRIFAITPCFRDDKINRVECRQKTFMKVELFVSCTPALQRATMFRLMSEARAFFTEEDADPVYRETEEGADWDVNGFEVGSYGYRTFGDLCWAYGTGLAEPRFSVALSAL